MRTPYLFFVMMRKLFIVSGGISNDLINRLISFCRPYKAPERVAGVLGELTPKNVSDICNSLVKNGYHIFNVTMSDEKIQNLLQFAKATECTPCGTNDRVIFNESLACPRFDFNGNDLVGNEAVCELVTDDSLRAIAGSYLKANPICDLITMWWSLPSEEKASEAAQMFHFDMDRLKFLKFFFYLTDVDGDTGPHCFVQSSHQRLPWSLRRDGRFSDQVILKTYGAESIKRITGKKGTILAVDTRGFHKGEKLKHGKRLLFQIEFSNSLFGMNYELLNKAKINQNYRNKFDQYPITYMSIFNK